MPRYSICPKCERFLAIPSYVNCYQFCTHLKEVPPNSGMINGYSKLSIRVEKIRCKIVEKN